MKPKKFIGVILAGIIIATLVIIALKHEINNKYHAYKEDFKILNSQTPNKFYQKEKEHLLKKIKSYEKNT